MFANARTLYINVYMYANNVNTCMLEPKTKIRAVEKKNSQKRVVAYGRLPNAVIRLNFAFLKTIETGSGA